MYSLSLLYNQKSLSKRKKENGITASKIENIRKNSYLKGFVRDLYLRPSCHNCKNKGFTSESDITLGDFWGIKETYPHLYDKDGVSCMSINTVRGEEYWKTIGAKSNQVSYSEALRFNPSFEQTSLTPPFRAFFFLLLGKLPFNILVFFIHVLNKAHKFLNILHKRPI